MGITPKPGYGMWIVGAILLSGAALTGLAMRDTASNIEAQARHDLDFAATEIRSNIITRLAANEALLQSGAAFIEAHGSPTRAQWREFVSRLRLETALPGTQGLGWSVLVPASSLARHIESVRAEGFPDYGIRPDGQRESYSSIIYLEPLDARNLRAIGYDMLSEPVRRQAMEKARDEDRAILSGKVILVQETNEDVQAGTLMYMPVFRDGFHPADLSERRAALVGWVYSPYRMSDLMRGILQGWEIRRNWGEISLKVYDGSKADAESLLYESRRAKLPALAHQFVNLEISGRPWTLEVTLIDTAISARATLPIFITALVGLALSVLLAGLAHALLGTRDRALRLAENLTADLASSEANLRAILETASSGISRVVDRTIVWANPAYDSVFGFDRGTTVGLRTGRFYPDSESFEALGREAYPRLGLGETFTTVRQMRKRDGSLFWSRMSGRLVDQGDPGAGSIWIVDDIGELITLEDELKVQRDFANLVLDSMGQGLTVTNAEGRFEFVNKAYASLFGFGPEEMIGRRPADFTTPEALAELALQRKLRGKGLASSYESRLLRAEGTVAPVLISAVPRGGPGDYRGTIAVITDLSAQKQNQAELEASFAKNKGLFLELQHRVKNSFNMITSLIGLSAMDAEDASIKGIFVDLESKVRSVAQLYSFLYATGSVDVVRLDLYCSQVVTAMSLLSRDISIQTNFEELAIPSKVAGPLGLILTEFLTNAIKYAYAPGEKGTIEVRLERTAGGGLLMVRDWGRGLPEEFDMNKSTGSGMLLATGLAEQIRSPMSIVPVDPGTLCTLEFPL
ncbi:MAG: CHASE domain-containing protein [Rectinemataceae bacterium]